ncbi:MAG: hypothetical protein IPH89_12565 [Bacteroidetes bacterium]|nr:hypothetical protein [Bacteroidota bacterium]
MQIKKQVDDIKNTQSESEKLEKKRIELVSKIVKSVLKKQNNMIKFNQFINDIHKKRKFARFDIKLENLKNKFKVNCGNIAADKAAAEQKIMYEFRHEIEVFKLELDMAEINLLTANDNFFT